MKPMKCESLMNKDGSLSLDSIKWPKLASPKFDGNRCYIEDGRAKSSSGKPIRNEYIQWMLSNPTYNGFDGELVVGKPTAPDVRRATHSGVSRVGGEPDFRFYVFDDFTNSTDMFVNRLAGVSERGVSSGNPCCYVAHHHLDNLEDLVKYEAKVIKQGYEGVVLRDARAPYKQGRSTLKENWALKLKRFVDAEAQIIGYYERMHNDNPQTRNAHGRAERLGGKMGLRPAGDLGGFDVRDVATGVVFRVGTGWSAAERTMLWLIRSKLVGEILTYKHFPVGAKDKPNLPIFVSFRNLEDM